LSLGKAKNGILATLKLVFSTCLRQAGTAGVQKRQSKWENYFGIVPNLDNNKFSKLWKKD